MSPGNNFVSQDLVLHQIFAFLEPQRKLTMNRRIIDDIEPIDYKTSRSICDAVGERLQQTLRPDNSRLSSYLQLLMDELRRRDRDGDLPH